MLKSILIAAAVVIVAGLAYIRLSPSDLAAYHLAPEATEPGDTPGQNRFKAARQITASPADILSAVDLVALATARTRLVAGDMDSGLLTYETRSALLGFPDYTTVTVTDAANGPLLVINAQSRFGSSDKGVNRARVTDWLARLGPLVVPAP